MTLDYSETDFDGGSEVLSLMAAEQLHLSDRGIGVACRPIDSAHDDRLYQVSNVKLIVHEVDELSAGG